jgi:hypothetical protein
MPEKINVYVSSLIFCLFGRIIKNNTSSIKSIIQNVLEKEETSAKPFKIVNKRNSNCLINFLSKRTNNIPMAVVVVYNG